MPINYRYAFSIIVFMIATVILFFMPSCKSENDQNASKEDFSASKEEDTDIKEPSSDAVILFYGNSLTAGYGLDEDKAFPALIQKIIDSLDLPYRVVNGGLSGETTSGGKSRLGWVLQNPVDIFVLELGANDMLRGLSVEATRKNLEDIILEVKSTWPETDIILCGMQAAPNMGNDYIREFSSIFIELAEKHSTGYIPFLLDGVAGNPSLNLNDLKHPNEEGHRIVAQNVWNVLNKYLQ